MPNCAKKNKWLFFSEEGVFIGLPYIYDSYAVARKAFIEMADANEWRVRTWLPYDEPNCFMHFNVTIPEGTTFTVRFQKVP